MKKIIQIILLLIVSVISNYSQSYTFMNITEKDGLSGNTVTDIFQDSMGYLWIITPDGVNLYNGYEFKIFRNDPFDSNSLSPGIATSISQTKDGSIWIGTTRGLNRYDILSNTFKYYSIESGLSFHQITELFTDRNGTLWVGMGDVIGRNNIGGLAYYDSTIDKFISFTHDSTDINSLSHNFVKTIDEDDEGILWIGTSVGLNKFNKMNSAFTQYYIEKSKDVESRVNFINDVLFDSDKILWIGADKGLFKFNSELEAFQKINYGRRKTRDANRVISLYEAPSDLGVIWVGTEDGLYEYNISVSSSTVFQKNGSESLPSNHITNIIEDHSGILWFGTNNSGLAKLNNFRPHFKYIVTDIKSTLASENNISAIYKNFDGYLLAGTNDQVVEIDLLSNQAKALSWDPRVRKLMENNRIVALFEDVFERLWIGTTDNGIIVVNSDTLDYHITESNSGGDNLILSNRISFITSFDNEHIFVGTKGGGLNQINVENLKITNLKIDSLNNKVNVLSYYFDNNYMWIGTTRGIRKFDLIENAFCSFQHEKDFDKYIGDDMILSFFKSKSDTNELWLGTINRGLCKLNLLNGEFDRKTVQNSSLPGNTINSMLDFGKNTIWASTNNGLVRIDIKNEEFRSYFHDDGAKVYQFNLNSAYKDEFGKLYYGGANGILYFDPSKVKKNLNPPKLSIGDFLINGKSIIRKGNKTFVQHLIDEEDLNLKYDENSITIDFVALHYSLPTNNRYEYQLVNHDEVPIETSEKRTVSYLNLNPGSYLFKLRATNPDGIKALNEIELNIKISPPFYKTWWAYSIYVIILLGIFLLYRKFVINKQLEKARLNESELRAEKAELKAEATASEAKVIQIESERKTKELEDARKLQLAMLPESIPELDKYEIAVYMKTASEVGGDYYDFSISDDGTLNVGFGDATGHGMQAGVVVSLIKGLFVSDSAENDLATFMMKSNNTIKKSRLGRMMMAFSLLKLKHYSVHISSAGMPPIYIYSASNKQVNEINLMGMPLGAMLNFPFRDIQIQVAKGDTILLISDGLPEMTNKSDEQFDYFRVSKLFKEIGAKSPDDIINSIIEASDEWIDGSVLDDDITLLAIKIK